MRKELRKISGTSDIDKAHQLLLKTQYPQRKI